MCAYILGVHNCNYYEVIFVINERGLCKGILKNRLIRILYRPFFFVLIIPHNQKQTTLTTCWWRRPVMYLRDQIDLEFTFGENKI